MSMEAYQQLNLFVGVIGFHSEAFSYGVQRLPINNSVLKYSIFVDILKRFSANQG